MIILLLVWSVDSMSLPGGMRVLDIVVPGSVQPSERGDLVHASEEETVGHHFLPQVIVNTASLQEEHLTTIIPQSLVCF